MSNIFEIQPCRRHHYCRCPCCCCVPWMSSNVTNWCSSRGNTSMKPCRKTRVKPSHVRTGDPARMHRRVVNWHREHTAAVRIQMWVRGCDCRTRHTISKGKLFCFISLFGIWCKMKKKKIADIRIGQQGQSLLNVAFHKNYTINRVAIWKI